MPSTVYVVDRNPDERAWMRAALEPSVADLVFLDDAAALPAAAGLRGDDCLIATADAVADAAEALQLVRRLRGSGAPLAVIVVGPHSAFRSAVELARFERTDFLERPISTRQLRAAVRRAIGGAAE